MSNYQVIAEDTLLALAELGFGKPLKSQPDRVHNIRIANLYLADDDSLMVIELDSQNVPPGIKMAKLTSNRVVHELTIRLGKRVHLLNTTGVSYAVELDQQLQKQLPRQTIFDPSLAPAGNYMIPIGYGRQGHVWRSLLNTSHILVGGESRSGKSTWINAMLCALLVRKENVDVRIIDPKGVEFVYYRGLLGAPLATEIQEAVDSVRILAAEMDERQRLFQAAYAKNLSQYNERAAMLGQEQLPLIACVIDEATDIMLQAGSDFETPLIRLASKGAGLGIILAIATQNPKYNVLDTVVRGNLSTRIAFRVATVDHSRTILGVSGAQDLPRNVRGRMLARLAGAPVELQGYYVPDRWVQMLTEKLRGKSLDPDAIHAPRLTQLERNLVHAALDEFDGAMPVNPMFELFRGQITQSRLKALLREWEGRGWLRDNGGGRHVTDELRSLAQE